MDALRCFFTEADDFTFAAAPERLFCGETVQRSRLAAGLRGLQRLSNQLERYARPATRGNRLLPGETAAVDRWNASR